jgi:metacaspase-1
MVFARANPRATVFFGSDSCHSGTLTRALAEELRRNGESPETYRAPRLWIPPDDVRSRQGLGEFDMWSLVEGEPAQKSRLEPTKEKVRRFGRFGHPPPEVPHLLLSGCKAEQVSWDAYFNGQHHGAMTFNFAKVVLGAWKKGKAISYAEAHAETVAGVREGFEQDPQLEGPASLAAKPVFDFAP